MSWLSEFARAIADSSANEASIYLLRNVPGLPPIVQTIHILAIAALMGSLVFIALRVLGLAARRQDLSEMLARLTPWAWAALGVLLASGLPFVVARPLRYFSNPVFGWKLAFIAPALLMSLLMLRQLRQQSSGPEVGVTLSSKVFASGALLFWVLTVLAGRWIAYAEYLFAPA